MGSLARPDWTPQEITYLKELCDSGLYRFTEIATKLGRTHRGTMYKCYERGFNNLYTTPFKYTYNRTFFDQITYETCYWAAVLTTDGCLSWRNGIPNIVWVAAEKDKGHMELFKTMIGSTHPLNKRSSCCQISTKDTTKRHVNYALSLENAREWTVALERHFGVTHNKTLRCPPPNLPSLQHRLAYIRGYIDGDGTVTCDPGGAITIGICGINREMIAWVRQVIEDMELPKAKKARPALIFQAGGENCYYYNVRGFRAAVLFELLRRLPTPHLSRKWDNPKVIDIVNTWKARVDLWPPEIFFTNLLGKAAVSPPKHALAI